jgi:regulator of protease activity HflC (stomatin/prohibitin superfamily)
MPTTHQKGEPMKERTIHARSGIAVLFLLLAVILAATAGLVQSVMSGRPVPIIVLSLVISAAALLLCGLFIVNPNEGKVLQLFGDYRGTVSDPGLRWANPFFSKQKVSLRVRNFETGKLKVNDSRGNPVDIAAVVVWKVVDTAEAVFHVDDFVDYVHVQSEAAVRNLATHYPYDAHEHDEVSLSSHTAEISGKLKIEIQERLTKAGVEVIEARISHLAYAPEIAAAMLQRQQASAVVAARQKIVEGAVGMVEMALEELSTKHVLELDEERRAAMVSNLLVVLCSDRHTQPVVNTGTLHN